MLHYFLQKGHDLKNLVRLSFFEKEMLKASMEIEIEQNKKDYEEIKGVK